MLPAARADFSSRIFAGDMSQELRCTNWFAKREVCFRRARPRLPSGHDTDAQIRPALSRQGDEIPAAAVRQANVAHDNVVWLTLPGKLQRRRRHGFGDFDLMTVRLQQRLHELSAVVMILEKQHAAWYALHSLGSGRHLDRTGRAGKYEAHRGADARHRFDLCLAAVSLHDAVDLGQAEARAFASLGSEERLKGAFANFGGHARAGVADIEAHF